MVIRAGSPSYLGGVQKNKIQLSFRPWFLRSKLESQRSHELLGDILSFEPLTKQLLNRQVLLDYRCPFGAGRQLSRQGHLIPESRTLSFDPCRSTWHIHHIHTHQCFVWFFKNASFKSENTFHVRTHSIRA